MEKVIHLRQYSEEGVLVTGLKKKHEKNSIVIKISQKVPEEMLEAFLCMHDIPHMFRVFCSHLSSEVTHALMEIDKESDNHPILSIQKVQTVLRAPVYQYGASPKLLHIRDEYGDGSREKSFDYRDDSKIRPREARKLKVNNQQALCSCEYHQSKTCFHRKISTPR